MLNALGKIFGQLFKLIYDMVSSLGAEPASISFYAIAIILTTIVLKLILIPISVKQRKSMQRMSEIQPKLKEIEKKYGYDPKTKQEKTMELFKKEGYNPMSGCLPTLIQFPIILGFFRMMQNPDLYIFGGEFHLVKANFFWIENLNLPDPTGLVLPLFSAGLTLASSYLMPRTPGVDEKAQQTQKMMMMIFPVIIFISARNFAAGLALYWGVSNAASVVEQLYNRKKIAAATSSKEEKK